MSKSLILRLTVFLAAHLVLVASVMALSHATDDGEIVTVASVVRTAD